jgi:hypothetical protein
MCFKFSINYYAIIWEYEVLTIRIYYYVLKKWNQFIVYNKKTFDLPIFLNSGMNLEITHKLLNWCVKSLFSFSITAMWIPPNCIDMSWMNYYNIFLNVHSLLITMEATFKLINQWICFPNQKLLQHNICVLFNF